MKTSLLKSLLCKTALLLALISFPASSLVAQDIPEKAYIKSLTVDPGTSQANIYFTVSLDAEEIEEPFVAYQMDIVLPEGLELEYRNGKPRVTLVKPSLYPYYVEEEEDEDGEIVETKVYAHSLNMSEPNGALRIIVYSSDPDENLRYFTKKSGDLFRVYVRPTAYLKPGDVEVIMRNVTFARMDATGNTVASISSTAVQASTGGTLTLRVSASNKYSTAVVPFYIAEIPAGLEVYSCRNTNGEYLVLEKQETIKAYTPYILYAENGYEGTFSGTIDASKYSEVVTDGFLTGAVVSQEIGGGNGYYVMQNKGEGVMFYSVNDETFSIPAGKCWLTLPAELQGNVAFRLDGTTGVDEVKGESGEVKGAIFDLTGRRVENPVKGIYIVNGKKVVL